MVNELPLARSQNLVVQQLDKELLIYDLTTHKASCLNETSATVWQLCDGERSVAEITETLSSELGSSVTDDLIWVAIDQLKENNLLENGEAVRPQFGGLTRREVIRRAGLATMIALPVISSLIAPTAAHAQSSGKGSVCNATCTCNAGGNIYLVNTFCTEPVLSCAPGCQCFATFCPADTTLPCTGNCVSII